MKMTARILWGLAVLLVFLHLAEAHVRFNTGGLEPNNATGNMRHVPNSAPPPLLAPSPSPALNAAAAAHKKILVAAFRVLFLPCAGMSAVLIVHIFLWYFTNDNDRSDSGAGGVGGEGKSAMESGLSVAELEKLPKVTGKELVMGTECAVCLDKIEEEQAARLVPVCNHGFHLQCADTWLSRHPVCPVCRVKLEPQFFKGAQNPC